MLAITPLPFILQAAKAQFRAETSSGGVERAGGGHESLGVRGRAQAY